MTPPEVRIYTWSSCSFCARAKQLLDAHGIAYTEESLDGQRRRLEALQKAFGRKTVPLILLDGELLGGLPELESFLNEHR